MNFANLLFEQLEPGIHLITINRPQSLNALDPATVREIDMALDGIERDEKARVLLITGAGSKAFVAGADIVAMRAMTPLEGRDFSAFTQRVFRRLERLRIPVIALVNGYALGGGCELAMSCDIVLASETAVFGQPEVNLGVSPGFGGSQRLPRLVGRALALELLLTGRQVKADEAVTLGLANHVYPPAELLERGLEMARQIAAKGPQAVRFVKELVQRGQDLDLDNACALESEVFGLLFSTEDKAEGMAAFVERRAAQFKNR
ncbi:MAG: enoyl-CoA hydratase-related protein [Rhodocyclaceae bacterium]|nr:enoyl-CoA hydratase-related protein [Rhodocyclaceae bacterium]